MLQLSTHLFSHWSIPLSAVTVFHNLFFHVSLFRGTETRGIAQIYFKKQMFLGVKRPSTGSTLLGQYLISCRHCHFPGCEGENILEKYCSLELSSKSLFSILKYHSKIFVLTIKQISVNRDNTFSIAVEKFIHFSTAL